jgi:hypothetical protein
VAAAVYLFPGRLQHQLQTLDTFELHLRLATPEPLFTDCFLHIAAVVLLLRWRFSLVMKRDETDLEVSYGLRDAQFGRVIVLKIRRSDEDDASVECIYVPYLHKRPSRTKPSCNPSAPFSQTIDAQTPMTQSGFVSRLVSAAVKCQSGGL